MPARLRKGEHGEQPPQIDWPTFDRSANHDHRRHYPRVFPHVAFADRPAYSVLGENASEAQVVQYREEHGLNDPVLVQYGNFMVGLVQGDLGTYGANNASVTDRVAQALPVTLQLTFMA